MKHWQNILDGLDHEEDNNNRKHSEHRDDMDTTAADRQLDEDETIPPAKMLKLSHEEDWLDIIYSRRAEDLHELVSDEAVSEAIRKLTRLQKEVLSLYAVHRFTVPEIAAMKSVSERNIRKIRQRAIENIHKTLADKKGEGDLKISVEIFFFFIACPFWIGWHISNWIYPKIKAKIMEKAA